MKIELKDINKSRRFFESREIYVNYRNKLYCITEHPLLFSNEQFSSGILNYMRKNEYFEHIIDNLNSVGFELVNEKEFIEVL
jgi:hypothetical protein